MNDKIILTTSEKELLEKKLTKKDLDNLYKKQKEIAELQARLDNLLKQEQQVQIPPK